MVFQAILAAGSLDKLVTAAFQNGLAPLVDHSPAWSAHANLFAVSLASRVPVVAVTAAHVNCLVLATLLDAFTSVANLGKSRLADAQLVTDGRTSRVSRRTLRALNLLLQVNAAVQKNLTLSSNHRVASIANTHLLANSIRTCNLLLRVVTTNDDGFAYSIDGRVSCLADTLLCAFPWARLVDRGGLTSSAGNLHLLQGSTDLDRLT